MKKVLACLFSLLMVCWLAGSAAAVMTYTFTINGVATGDSKVLPTDQAFEDFATASSGEFPQFGYTKTIIDNYTSAVGGSWDTNHDPQLISESESNYAGFSSNLKLSYQFTQPSQLQLHLTYSLWALTRAAGYDSSAAGISIFLGGNQIGNEVLNGGWPENNISGTMDRLISGNPGEELIINAWTSSQGGNWSGSLARSATEISNLELDPVPLPAGWLLVGSGLAFLAGYRRRFRKS